MGFCKWYLVLSIWIVATLKFVLVAFGPEESTTTTKRWQRGIEILLSIPPLIYTFRMIGAI